MNHYYVLVDIHLLRCRFAHGMANREIITLITGVYISEVPVAVHLIVYGCHLV